MTDIYPLYPVYSLSDAARLTPSLYAADLESLISKALALWRQYDDVSASKPNAHGKWTTKQVIGHLCDSAGNNLQRIVRLSLQNFLLFPRYEQEKWVSVQQYDLRSLADLLHLFESVQRHLAHVIRFLEPESLEHVWIDDGKARPLRHLVEDYLGHLQHHMDQVPVVAKAIQHSTKPFLELP